MNRFLAPSRSAYLERQKNEFGRHLFGVFPAHYPREILWAMNALPVEIWDPPLTGSQAGAHLQPYICSVVRLGLELVLQGRGRILDGFLFPHTCDSIQNLASIVYDYLGLKKPCYFFYHPKAPYRPSARDYYRDQVRSLVRRLEQQLGPLDPQRLAESVALGQEIGAVQREIYALRAAGDLRASNAAFYQVLRQGEFLHPDDYLPLLQDFLAEESGPAGPGPAVVLSGVLPNPREVLGVLDEAGVRVAEDDLLNCGRRLPGPAAAATDPYEALAESYFAMPPCSTKDSPTAERLDGLVRRIEASGARGVIFWMVRFCEPELFDLPQLREALKDRGVATLVIDVEVNQGLSGQLRTRIEAFAELIG